MNDKNMEKEYITVREYAQIKNCSPQYVYRLLQTKLQPYLIVVDGKKCLKIEVLEDEKDSVSTKVDNQVANHVDNQVANPSASNFENELKRINARNEDLIDDLRKQIKEKDELLKQMNDKIVNLFETNQRLLENNQKLQLNYQMLLGIGENTVVDAEVNAEDKKKKKKSDINLEEPPEEPKKKGFFRRLFNIS